MKDFFQTASVEAKLRMAFTKKALLLTAFTHRSFWNEHQEQVPDHNERLEFLGDSVLGLIVADYLFSHHPHLDEGSLSTIRSQLVEAPACAAYVQKLEIASFLLLGKGEKHNAGKGRESILADLFEALIGAIYIDQGWEAACSFFFTHFTEDVEQMVATPHRNWKAELQDYAQKNFQQVPIYEVCAETGPSHQKNFCISVWVSGKKWGEGRGSSKKEGQVEAAKNALLNLEKKRPG